jgi:hypothetical protein
MREKLTYDPGDVVNVSWAYVSIPRCTALCSFRTNRCHSSCNITAAVAVVVVEVAIEVVEIIIVAKMRNKQEKK